MYFYKTLRKTRVHAVWSVDLSTEHTVPCMVSAVHAGFHTMSSLYVRTLNFSRQTKTVRTAYVGFAWTVQKSCLRLTLFVSTYEGPRCLQWSDAFYLALVIRKSGGICRFFLTISSGKITSQQVCARDARVPARLPSTWHWQSLRLAVATRPRARFRAITMHNGRTTITSIAFSFFFCSFQRAGGPDPGPVAEATAIIIPTRAHRYRPDDNATRGGGKQKPAGLCNRNFLFHCSRRTSDFHLARCISLSLSLFSFVIFILTVLPAATKPRTCVPGIRPEMQVQGHGDNYRGVVDAWSRATRPPRGTSTVSKHKKPYRIAYKRSRRVSRPLRMKLRPRTTWKTRVRFTSWRIYKRKYIDTKNFNYISPPPPKRKKNTPVRNYVQLMLSFF